MSGPEWTWFYPDPEKRFGVVSRDGLIVDAPLDGTVIGATTRMPLDDAIGVATSMGWQAVPATVDAAT